MCCYNDHYGHAAGDECLKAIGELLRRKVPRKTDLIARYGGEEFAVVFPDTPPDEVLRLSESIREGVEQLAIEHAKSDAATVVTISGGVAVVEPDQNTPPSSLIKSADLALYQSKEKGRNRVTAFRSLL